MTEQTILYILIGLVAVLLVLVIFLLFRNRRITHSFDIFMRGKDAENLESTIVELMDRVENLEVQDMANKDVIRVINRQLVNCYQKTGVVKYNAFDGMGGQSSCAITLMDLNNNGILIDVIHSRSTCYTYVKEISGGECEAVMSAEEKASLMLALQKKDRFFNPDEELLDENS